MSGRVVVTVHLFILGIPGRRLRLRLSVRARRGRDILTSMRRHLGTLAAALGCALLAGAAVAQAERPSGFTAEERRRLEEGELIVRPVTRRRGSLRLIGGSSWQIVDLSASATWRALCDPESYRRMLPAAEETRVVADRANERVVRVSHAAGLVRASYHLRMNYDHARRDIAFRLDEQRPNDLRAAWGFISVAPYEGDAERALVSYGVMADVGGGILGGIMRSAIHDWMLRVPSTIRGYLHGSGRHRYHDE